MNGRSSVTLDRDRNITNTSDFVVPLLTLKIMRETAVLAWPLTRFGVLTTLFLTLTYAPDVHPMLWKAALLLPLTQPTAPTRTLYRLLQYCTATINEKHAGM